MWESRFLYFFLILLCAGDDKIVFTQRPFQQQGEHILISKMPSAVRWQIHEAMEVGSRRTNSNASFSSTTAVPLREPSTTTTTVPGYQFIDSNKSSFQQTSSTATTGAQFRASSMLSSSDPLGNSQNHMNNQQQPGYSNQQQHQQRSAPVPLTPLDPAGASAVSFYTSAAATSSSPLHTQLHSHHAQLLALAELFERADGILASLSTPTDGAGYQSNGSASSVKATKHHRSTSSAVTASSAGRVLERMQEAMASGRFTPLFHQQTAPQSYRRGKVEAAPVDPKILHQQHEFHESEAAILSHQPAATNSEVSDLCHHQHLQNPRVTQSPTSASSSSNSPASNAMAMDDAARKGFNVAGTASTTTEKPMKRSEDNNNNNNDTTPTSTSISEQGILTHIRGLVHNARSLLSIEFRRHGVTLSLSTDNAFPLWDGGVLSRAQSVFVGSSPHPPPPFSPPHDNNNDNVRSQSSSPAIDNTSFGFAPPPLLPLETIAPIFRPPSTPFLFALQQQQQQLQKQQPHRLGHVVVFHEPETPQSVVTAANYGSPSITVSDEQQQHFHQVRPTFSSSAGDPSPRAADRMTTSSPEFCRIYSTLTATHPPTTTDEQVSDVPAAPPPSRRVTNTLTHATDELSGHKMINQYLILDDIGEGACGKVKLAYSLERNITVAIKVVRRAPGGGTEGRSLGRRKGHKEETLRNEVELMKRLRHPNLVSLFEVIDDPNAKKLYLVMRFADKGSVGAMREDLTCDAMPLRALVDMAFQVCCGLQYLHERGIYHRDIKPENILQTSDGQYMIGDFGISVVRRPTRKRSTSSSTGSIVSHTGSFLKGEPEGAMLGIGTPLFMAPELLLSSVYRSRQLTDGRREGAVDLTEEPPAERDDTAGKTPDQRVASDRAAYAAGDLWSLGVTILSLLCGECPFDISSEMVSVEPNQNSAAELLQRAVMHRPLCESEACYHGRREWAATVAALLSINPDDRPRASAVRKASKSLLASGCLCELCSNHYHHASEVTSESPLEQTDADGPTFDKLLALPKVGGGGVRRQRNSNGDAAAAVHDDAAAFQSPSFDENNEFLGTAKSPHGASSPTHEFYPHAKEGSKNSFDQNEMMLVAVGDNELPPSAVKSNDDDDAFGGDSRGSQLAPPAKNCENNMKATTVVPAHPPVGVVSEFASPRRLRID